jgi:hypothetical protein
MRIRGALTRPVAAAPTAAVAPGHVACPYCNRGIAADDFSPWTGRPELLSAACQCGRSVTMAAVTLRRLTATENMSGEA